MRNSYFRFKQFTIQQERSAMKVCTDSCILGAWAAGRLHEAKTKSDTKTILNPKTILNSKKILDIGTGTGLLSLMLAQKSDGLIDSIELDPESAAEARENILASPWKERIRLLEGDIRIYALATDYDFIITNPPFYESQLKSPAEKINKARHDESLTLEELITAIRAHLKTTGFFGILLPFHRSEYFEKLAADQGFYLEEKLSIRQTPAHDPFRNICLFSFKKPEELIIGELIIKNENGNYNSEFTELLTDYYE
jgi:tRNA1Val (adenine37-N6)-methyltransferase